MINFSHRFPLHYGLVLMSMSTSDFQQFLKAGESDLWSEEVDDVLTILSGLVLRFNGILSF